MRTLAKTEHVFHSKISIVSRRFRTKSTTLTMASFFVTPQTSSCMYYFLQTSLVHVYSSVHLVYGNPAVTGSSPCLSQKNFFEQFFSALCDFLAFKGSHTSSFFDILQQSKVTKSPKRLPFYVFRHYENVQNSHFSKIKKSSPFNLIFCNKLDFQKPEGYRFYRFKNCAF